MKWLRIFVLFCLISAPLTGCQSKYQPGTLTDDAGRVVNISQVPKRIVSHVPSITETLFALGLSDRLVGVSDYCDYPEEAKSKPSVGNYFNPSVEKIVALEPDLVLTDGHSESLKKLADLGIPLFVIAPKDIESVMKDIELLGKITGTEKAALEIVSRMKQDIEAVTARVKSAPKPRVFYGIDLTNPALPWTAGPGSFIDALINLAGGENIAAEAPGAWVKFSLEAIVSADPEIIILPESHGKLFTGVEELKKHPIWQTLTAVRENRIYTIDAELVERTGPRLTQGLKMMAETIHPELFK